MGCMLRLDGFDPPPVLAVHDDGNCPVSAALLKGGVWEPFETALLRNLLAPGDVFLDAGANLGYYTVLASRLVGDEGQVLAFEPETANYALLVHNVCRNNCANVRLFNAALSDHNGTGLLRLSPSNRGDHCLAAQSTEGSLVRVLHAGEQVARLSHRLDVVKIDTQGSEADILRALLPQLLASGEHLSLLVECWPAGLLRCGATVEDFASVLSTLALPLWLVDHVHQQLHPWDLPGLLTWMRESITAGHEGFCNLLVSTRQPSPGL